mgnify:CR=1 FL=1
MNLFKDFLSNFQFEPIEFVRNLRYMGMGMLIILGVMAVIIGITVFLNYMADKVSDEKNDGDSKENQ